MMSRTRFLGWILKLGTCTAVLILTFVVARCSSSPGSPLQAAVDLLELTKQEQSTLRITVLGTISDGPYLIDYAPSTPISVASEQLAKRHLISNSSIWTPQDTLPLAQKHLGINSSEDVAILAQGETRGRLMVIYAALGHSSNSQRIAVFLTQPTSEF